MIVTLNRAKLHLKVTDNTDDELITLFIQTAEEAIVNYIDRNIPGSPKSLQSAALLMVADLYENRQGQVVGNTNAAIHINPTLRNLMNPYRANMGV